MDLNELYYRYEAAENAVRRAPDPHSRIMAVAALSRAFYALGHAIGVPYHNNRTLRAMRRNNIRTLQPGQEPPEFHRFRNNAWERRAEAAIRELKRRYRAATISIMPSLPRNMQEEILLKLGSVF